MKKLNTQIKPFIKWAGGKTRLSDIIISNMPTNYNTYIEPMIGGGAVFFKVKPSKAIINDINNDLMDTYSCFTNKLLFDKLIKKLEEYSNNHSETFYNTIRNQDRDINYQVLPVWERAARLIYLNKSCFNGLYRVNSEGYFNVPMNKHNPKPTIYNVDNLIRLYNYLSKLSNTNSIQLKNWDYKTILELAEKDDFIYIDPPYDSFESKKVFNNYTKSTFDRSTQIELKNEMDKLTELGAKVMISNYDTPFIEDLYKNYKIIKVAAKCMIGSKNDSRKEVVEVLIVNY